MLLCFGGFAGLLGSLRLSGFAVGLGLGLGSKLGGGIDLGRLCKLSLGGTVLAQGRGMLAGKHGAKVDFWSAVDALGAQAQVRHALIDTSTLQMLVLDVGPQLAGCQQALFCACAVFLAAAPLRLLRVRALEEKFRVSGNAVQSPLAVHDVGMRLLAFFNRCLRNVDIQRYFDWMMSYSDDETIKGDFEIEVRASSALVERDAQQQFLMTLLQVAANPVYELDPAKLAGELCRGQRLDPKNFQLDDEQKAQRAQQARQPQDPTLEAKAKLLEAQARKADADTTARGVETQYSAVQTAQVIVQTPVTSGLADGLLRSAGYVDRDAAPIVPEAPAGLPSVDMPQNTNPLTPANPGVGLNAGIETPAADGAHPGATPL